MATLPFRRKTKNFSSSQGVRLAVGLCVRHLKISLNSTESEYIWFKPSKSLPTLTLLLPSPGLSCCSIWAELSRFKKQTKICIINAQPYYTSLLQFFQEEGGLYTFSEANINILPPNRSILLHPYVQCFWTHRTFSQSAAPWRHFPLYRSRFQ